MRTVFGTFAAATILLATAGCGDDSAASPGTLAAVPTIDDIEIDPDARRAGGLFGAATEQSGQGDEPEIICPSEGECVPDVIAPPDTFVPLPENQAFCTLLAEIEQRPYPEDEKEGMVVSQGWLQELRPTVPPTIAESYDLVVEVVDLIVASGSSEQDLEAVLTRLEPERAEAMEVAIDEVVTFVEASC